jgi:hypothetical protein
MRNVSAKTNSTSARSAGKRKASKSIPDETEVQSKFKRCLADSRKYGQFGKVLSDFGEYDCEQPSHIHAFIEFEGSVN